MIRIKKQNVYMIEKISFKCLIFLTVLPRDVFKNPTKGPWWSIFEKIFNDYFYKKAPS